MWWLCLGCVLMVTDEIPVETDVVDTDPADGCADDAEAPGGPTVRYETPEVTCMFHWAIPDADGNLLEDSSGTGSWQVALDVEDGVDPADFAGAVVGRVKSADLVATGRLTGGTGAIAVGGACAAGPVVGCGDVTRIDASTLHVDFYAENERGGPCWIWCEGDISP